MKTATRRDDVLYLLAITILTLLLAAYFSIMWLLYGAIMWVLGFLFAVIFEEDSNAS